MDVVRTASLKMGSWLVGRVRDRMSEQVQADQAMILIRPLGDAACEDVRDYFWRAGDPKGRGMQHPLPNFVATGRPDASRFERLLLGVANDSAASQEEKAAVTATIRQAFEAR